VDTLYYNKTFVDYEDCDPMTTCSHRDCIDYIEDKSGNSVIVYKSKCHLDCHLTDVRTKAFGGKGDLCKHSFEVHLHIIKKQQNL